MTKISIITVCFNSEKTIRDTIDSVLGQTLQGIEYIIIDGGSTDNTIAIVREYENQIAKIVSEPDLGIYDAMNKGIGFANSDYIGILNSDDLYASPNILERVVKLFHETGVECIHGDLVYVDRINTERIIRKWKSSPYVFGAFRNGWHPPHPAFFVQRTLYQKFGNFDLAIPLVADFDIMYRFLEIYKCSNVYIPELFVRMRVGGVTSGSLINIFIGNINIIKIFKKYNVRINSAMYLLKRIIPKFLNLIKIGLHRNG